MRLYYKKIFLWKRKVPGRLPLISLMSKAYGINFSTSFYTFSRYGLPRSIKSGRTKRYIRRIICELFDSKLNLARGLAKLKSSRLAEMSKYGTKRSRRRIMGLPVNGQRTHSNSQTIRRFLRKRKPLIFYY